MSDRLTDCHRDVDALRFEAYLDRHRQGAVVGQVASETVPAALGATA